MKQRQRLNFDFIKAMVITIVLTFSVSDFNGQDNRSNTYIDTYYHGEKHFSINDASIVTFNENNHELIVAIDFASLKSGIDSLDEWLLDLTESKFIFRGSLPVTDLLALTHHNAKSLVINGMVEFNGKTHRQPLLISFYEISKEGMLFRNTGSDYYDRLSANIQMTFLPKHFGVDKKPHHLKKKISIAIGRGIINKA